MAILPYSKYNLAKHQCRAIVPSCEKSCAKLGLVDRMSIKPRKAQDMRSVQNLLSKTPLNLRYGLLLACGLVFLKVLERSFYADQFSLELYTGLVALLFLIAGAGIGARVVRSDRKSRSVTNQRHTLSSRAS